MMEVDRTGHCCHLHHVPVLTWSAARKQNAQCLGRDLLSMPQVWCVFKHVDQGP